MKVIYQFVLLFVLVSLSLIAKGQVEGVYVERYYVSDAFDATDTTGGSLDSGSVTYRIYVNLKKDSKLIKIYGDQNHPLQFSSTALIFNNAADGNTFGKDFTRSRLQENTVALDSWLTLGQTTRTSSKTTFGVPKSWDDDGSFIGGVNNDGGSAAIATGLLTNNDPSASPAITAYDGMDTMTLVPSSWVHYGIQDDITGADSTIFGSLKEGNQFSCTNCGLQNSGVTGVNTDSNFVLVAQITTKGELSFSLNLVVEEPATPNNIFVKYVSALATGEFNSDTLKISPYLKYPSVCGCKDPNYLEYSSSFACNAPDSCRTLIHYGCLDTSACNYDPTANFHISQLCCYPGYCNDRNLGVVCPELNGGKNKEDELLVLFPVPAGEILNVQYIAKEESVSYSIESSLGEIIYAVNKGVKDGAHVEQLDISGLTKGIYFFHLQIGNKIIVKRWVKI